MTSTVESLLPLQPATFHILVALADEDRHGYAIMQDVAARTRDVKHGGGDTTALRRSAALSRRPRRGVWHRC